LTTVLVALGASLGTVVVLAVLHSLVRRSNSSQQRMSLVVRDLNERVELMRRELQAALDQAHEERRRNRFLGALEGSIDLEDVVARGLAAARSLPAVDAALISLSAAGGGPLVEASGMTDEEAADYAVSAALETTRLAASTTSSPPAGAGAISAGVAVPIQSETAQLGVLAVFTRSDADALANLDLELESLALRAAPWIENARRFREARQLADLDALTGLHNRRYFHETLAREVSRAHRYERRLALILFDLDDFKAINDRIGHLAGDAVLAEISERVREVVRSADVPCRVGGDEFGVILPESTLEDADQLYARLRSAIAARPNPLAGRPLTVSAGVAELRPEDNPTAFFQRADDALYRAKAGGKGRVASHAADPNPS
jgi:diguanylate cyclase (GGDEF)-like protein